MAYTFPEMLHELKKLDEMTLLEVLDMDSELLVMLLEDHIEEYQESIRKKLGLDD